MSQSSLSPIALKISMLEEVIGRLSPVQKMLLGTDGSVTRLLEVITGEPVKIETLLQEIVTANETIAEDLNIDVGDEVNYRVVKLQNSATGETLIYAVSYTPLGRLDWGFRDDLMRADIPIGAILKKHKIESRRDITETLVVPADSKLSKIFNVFVKEPLLSRNYKIIRQGQPLISITETFPYNQFQDERKVIIETPSRIHMTLIDLAGKYGRVDGGIGIALDEPNILLEGERNKGLTVNGDFAERIASFARAVIDHFELGGVRICLRSAYRQHVGLGSGTQLALATGKAICELYEIPATIHEIASIVGRGGTSGIGTAAFESGGFIIDGGHSFGPGREKSDFRPSRASAGVRPPPITARHDFPRGWNIILAIPEISKGADGQKEVDIFREFCPVPFADVQELCYQIMVRMVPSILEEDLDEFGEAVNRIQELGFKKVEQSLQDPLISNIMAEMREAGAACSGLSSFGPTVYAITDTSVRDIEAAAHDAMEEVGGEVLITRARNEGARIRTI